MKSIEEIISHPKINARQANDTGFFGTVVLKGVKCSIICTSSEQEGEHISVAPFNKSIPTWDMMAQLKNMCFDDEEEVYEIHPPKSEYVNIKKNCLHLWRRSDGRRLFDNEGKE